MRSKVRHRMQGKREKSKHLIIIRRFTILALVGIMIYTVGLFMLEKPKVVNLRDFELIPAQGEKIIKVQSAFSPTKLEVQIIQGEKVYNVFSNYINREDQSITLRIDTSSIGMKEGPAKVVIKLTPNIFFTRSYNLDSYIDAKAPNIELLSITDPLKQGLAGAIKLKIEGAVGAYLRINGVEYSLYSMDSVHYLALFPVESWDKLKVRVSAKDQAGNLSHKEFSVAVLPSSFIGKPSAQSIKNLQNESEPRKLWEKSFIKPSRDSVTATNNGVVVAIEQNRDGTKTVILDHGLGLMSLYKSLNEVSVSQGEYVKKGYNIGKASKDFYFGLLVQGKEVEVSPWLDNQWIYENIEKPLKIR